MTYDDKCLSNSRKLRHVCVSHYEFKMHGVHTQRKEFFKLANKAAFLDDFISYGKLSLDSCDYRKSGAKFYKSRRIIVLQCTF